MGKDVLTAAAIITTESGERFKLNYYVRSVDLKDEKVFALRADKTEAESGKLLSTQASLPLSADYDYACRMTQAFANGHVTPGVLIEMCDEYNEA